LTYFSTAALSLARPSSDSFLISSRNRSTSPFSPPAAGAPRGGPTASTRARFSIVSLSRSGRSASIGSGFGSRAWYTAAPATAVGSSAGPGQAPSTSGTPTPTRWRIS
jgi:hypothetical protein